MDIKKSDIFIRNSTLGRKNKIILMIYGFKIFYIFKKIVEAIFHLELPKCVYKNRLRIERPYNILINSKAKIGKNVTTYPNVIIGSKQFGNKKGVPTIEDNVIIYPHSVIIGDITIGKNAIIGAGSIVFNNVPENAIVAGNPAKIVGSVEE